MATSFNVESRKESNPMAKKAPTPAKIDMTILFINTLQKVDQSVYINRVDNSVYTCQYLFKGEIK